MTDDPHSPPVSVPPQNPTEDDLWTNLRRLTAARIGLKRSGASLATGPLLDFQLAHARARDAVHEQLDEAGLVSSLSRLGQPVLVVRSAVEDRQQYLMRPDLGRRLAQDAATILAPYAGHFDVAFVVSDGLSARAVQTHAAAILTAVSPLLRTDKLLVAPFVIVRYGRVAIGDQIAIILGARCVVTLIGERPGLSSPDSMGAYLTWQPRPETTDADRNCISNIRPDGIGYAAAAGKIVHLLKAMRALRLSGVRLKDDSDRLLIDDK